MLSRASAFVGVKAPKETGRPLVEGTWCCDTHHHLPPARRIEGGMSRLRINREDRVASTRHKVRAQNLLTAQEGLQTGGVTTS